MVEVEEHAKDKQKWVRFAEKMNFYLGDIGGEEKTE